MRLLGWQLEALAEASRDLFATRMVPWMRRHHAGFSEPLDDEALERWLRRGVDAASARGIRLEPDVARFMLVASALGVDLDEGHPWTAEILDHPTLEGIGKVRQLVRGCHEREVALPAAADHEVRDVH